MVGRSDRSASAGPVGYGDLDQDVFGARLGVLDEHIEIAVFGEGTGVQQLILEISAIPAAVFFDDFSVRKFKLGILVESLHVRVRGSRIEIEIILLHVLAMISFIARKAKEAFFEDWIAAIPQSQSEAHEL